MVLQTPRAIIRLALLNPSPLVPERNYTEIMTAQSTSRCCSRENSAGHWQLSDPTSLQRESPPRNIALGYCSGFVCEAGTFDFRNFPKPEQA
jgi:hypothetical protein